MINNTLPPAPIEDKDCRLTFCVDGIVYAVNTLSEEEREECKAKLNKHSGRTFEWVVEHGGERHWVLYDTAMYHKEHSTLTYIDSCTLAPTIPINATSCYEMFRGCEYVNLSAFNTENIIEMSYMFEHALYDEDPGWVIDNGRRVSWNQSIGWINHLFGTRYCPKDVAPIKQKENAETEPFSEVTTSEYFRQTGYTAFWHMPGEEIMKPDYILTDDDRLYWWDGTDEVVISENVIALFREYNLLFKSMLENELTFRGISGDHFGNAEDFTQEFIEILADIDEQYRRIFPFESMFYEFIENKEKVEYRAAAGLLYYLLKRYAKEGKVIEKCGFWDIASKNIICNEGRMKIKQYLAVMANKKLREKFFGF